MAARILDLCDALAATVQAAWAPTAPDAVSREYGLEVGLDPTYADILLTGRKVYVFPASYNNDRILDRKSTLDKYTVSVLICERFSDVAGSINKAWMDARVLFVEQSILRTLSNLEYRPLASGSYRGMTIDPEQLGVVDVVFDRDLYMQRKTFWSQCTFVYQEAN